MKNFPCKSISFKQQIISYIIGFFLSLLLTIIPFFLVIKNIFDVHITYLIVILCALIQIIIQMKYFLHITYSKNNFWIVFFLVFSIIIIFIIMFGSIWIMYHLNHHLMNYIDL